LNHETIDHGCCLLGKKKEKIDDIP
jgi:hypothetical protein